MEIVIREDSGIPGVYAESDITSAHYNIFKNFFKGRDKEREFPLSQQAYQLMIYWLEAVLRGETLYDYATKDRAQRMETEELIRVYKQMKNANITEGEIIYKHRETKCDYVRCRPKRV